MTIYALSSGPGISGVAIVRVSGEETKSGSSVINRQKSSTSKKGHSKKDQ